MRRLFSLLILVLAPAFAAPTAPGEHEVQPSAFPRVASYELDVTFLPVEGGLRGLARVTFHDTAARPGVSFFLHGELDVESAALGGEGLEVRQERVFYPDDYSLVATRVDLDTGGRDLGRPLEISYEGFVHASKARSPSDYMRIDEDEVLLRAYGYSLWFPTFLPADRDGYDANFEVTLRTPPELVSVFAGELLDRRTEGELAVSRWRATGLPLYAAQASARDWVVQSRGSIFVYSEPDPESRAQGETILDYVARLQELFRHWYRDDVAEGQFHVLQMPAYGDISSQNVVGLTGGIWLEIDRDVNAKRALAHELVHPFVRPRVGRADPLYSLAIEGFPSYFHLPALAELEGEAESERFLRWREHLYLEHRRTGLGWRDRPLPPEKPLLEISADELSTYKDVFVLPDRALLLFDFVRRRLGPERFHHLTRELFAKERLGATEFEALLVRHLPGEEATIHRWLHTTDYPPEMRIPSKPEGSP